MTPCHCNLFSCVLWLPVIYKGHCHFLDCIVNSLGQNPIFAFLKCKIYLGCCLDKQLILSIRFDIQSTSHQQDSSNFLTQGKKYFDARKHDGSLSVLGQIRASSVIPLINVNTCRQVLDGYKEVLDLILRDSINVCLVCFFIDRDFAKFVIGVLI